MARRWRFDRRGVLAGGLAALATPQVLRAAPRLRVFAAASLKGALDQIAPVAALVYGGSGAIARQISYGAPADIVILAASDWMDWLARSGRIREPRVVASNRLILAGQLGAGAVALTADALSERLGDGRIAMGDPLSVPAGRYAQQALETLGLWPVLADQTIFAENVRAALAYVARGDVPLGVVYRSDARFARVEVAATFPQSSHAQIRYPAAVLQGAAPGAEALLEQIAAADDVFADHGFSPA